MLNKTKIKFEYLLIICLSLVFIICNQKIAQAEETGCCILVSNAAGFENKTYRTTTESNCSIIDPMDGKTKIKGEFHPNQKVGPDNKSCVDKATTEARKPRAIVPPVLSVSIPGFGKFSEIKCDEKNTDCSIPWIGEYIKAIFEYSIKIIGLLAVIVIMIGGIIWLMTGGNKEKVSQAMNFIKGGVLGLTIALCSYALLFILNPNLVILRSINIQYQKNEDLDFLETSDPVDLSEVSDKCTDPSTWVELPTNIEGIKPVKGLKSSPASIEKLKQAAPCFVKNGGYVTLGEKSASRTPQQQRDLYDSMCKNNNGTCKCKVNACCPYGKGKICPHTCGSAFDLTPVGISYNTMQKCMFEVGFVLLCCERWHFEYPKISPCSEQKTHEITSCKKG